MQPDLSHLQHVVLDMDGTIYKGKTLFACTLPFLKALRAAGIGYTFLTNNTSRSKADYATKLRGFGIDSLRAANLYSRRFRHRVPARPHPAARSIAVSGLRRCACSSRGWISRHVGLPEAVVVGFDTTLTFDRLCRAAWWISRGLPFIATHPDLVCPTDEPTVLVDCGSICAALTAATGRHAGRARQAGSVDSARSLPRAPPGARRGRDGR